MDLGDFADVCGCLPGVLVEPGMMGVNDVVGEGGEFPDCAVLPLLARCALCRLDLPLYGIGVEPFVSAGGREGYLGYLAAAGEVDAVFLEDCGDLASDTCSPIVLFPLSFCCCCLFCVMVAPPGWSESYLCRMADGRPPFLPVLAMRGLLCMNGRSADASFFVELGFLSQK